MRSIPSGKSADGSRTSVILAALADSGRASRELHDLDNKRNMGKPEHQRVMARRLTAAAKEVKKRPEEVFGQNGGPRVMRLVAGSQSGREIRGYGI